MRDAVETFKSIRKVMNDPGVSVKDLSETMHLSGDCIRKCMKAETLKAKTMCIGMIVNEWKKLDK